MEKHDPAIARVGPEQRRTDRLRESEADCAADQRAEQIRDFGVPEARLDPHDQNAQAGANKEIDERARAEGTCQNRRVCDRGDEESAGEEEPRHV